MTIHLPPDLEGYVQGEVQRGRFGSEEEAITEAVKLLRQQQCNESTASAAAHAQATPESDLPPPCQMILDVMKDVPDDAFDRIPADSSEQLDHYVYGTPKRPKS